uniref:ATP synthase subunit a n=1 Tax=Syndesmis echinorum TaxID=2019369 RepID=A0A7G5XUL4_9PLAT|nr:ATP synthase F0 subunit 6 [Syndesmis echinorum]QNA49649.1 ATP synthase subunit 6 [Syndesmis echinorum]
MQHDLFASMDFFQRIGGGVSVIFLFGLIWLVLFQSSNGIFSFPLFSYSGYSLVGSKLLSGVSKEGGLVCWTILFMLSFTNLWGLNPLGFPISSHFFFGLVLAFILWGSLQFSGWSHSFSESLGGLVPGGVSVGLGVFLSIVELISNLIRPLTLSLRLAVNMTSGHVMVGFIAGGVFLSSLFYVLLMFYMLFECAICLVQGVVFSMLLGEYEKEIF